MGDVSSVKSLSSASNPRSLRMLWHVEENQVHVLIDSGSTHNFINPKVAEKLGVQVESSNSFRVYIDNGDSMICQYYCPHVPLTLQGIIFKLDLFVLAVQGPDVLGIPWLQQLRPIIHDYCRMSMEFKWKNKKVKLVGDTNLGSKKVTFSQLVNSKQWWVEGKCKRCISLLDNKNLRNWSQIRLMSKKSFHKIYPTISCRFWLNLKHFLTVLKAFLHGGCSTIKYI